MNPHIRAFSPILCLSTQVGEESPSWGFHAAMVTRTVRLVSSGYACAVRVRAASGAPGYGVWLTALRVSSLWSAKSAQTISMVSMPVTADTTPWIRVVARLPMVARRPGGRDPGASALERGHAVHQVRVCPGDSNPNLLIRSYFTEPNLCLKTLASTLVVFSSTSAEVCWFPLRLRYFAAGLPRAVARYRLTPVVCLRGARCRFRRRCCCWCRQGRWCRTR